MDKKSILKIKETTPLFIEKFDADLKHISQKWKYRTNPVNGYLENLNRQEAADFLGENVAMLVTEVVESHAYAKECNKGTNIIISAVALLQDIVIQQAEHIAELHKHNCQLQKDVDRLAYFASITLDRP